MIDYKEIRLKAGLEIHQQLDTNKLFCSCPSLLRNDPPLFKITRKLNPVIGETGEIDIAAEYEKQKNETFSYQVYDTNCLVELDEEPPHEINQEALEITLQIAELLNCKIFPVTQIMRKTVVNGSNTSGFQRTVLIAHDGWIETSEGKVGIETIALEEDAARPSSTQEEDDPELENSKLYKLDRLGIPLVEITTKPDLKSPQQIKEAALKIGEILRACKVKRGIGTIRQDVNISISEGNRVEIKGFQDQKTMIQTVENEIQRQSKILELKNKFKTKTSKTQDVTPIFENTKCNFIKKAIENNNQAFAFKIENFKGILGTELQPGKRVGTDLSDLAKSTSGIGGIIHSDENLEKYDFSQKEINSIVKTLEINNEDAFIIIISNHDKAEKAIMSIKQRLNQLSSGVPKEVRRSNPDATTSFLRPMPGSARMYPETDLQLLKISRELINKAKKTLPKLASENKSYLQEFGLNDELIKLILKQNKVDEFKTLLNTSKNANIIAKILVIFTKEISVKEKIPIETVQEKLSTDVIEAILQNLEKSNISESDIKNIMLQIVKGKTLEQATKKEKINLNEEIKKLRKEKPNLSTNAYMGLIMAKFKGQISGKDVMNELAHLGILNKK